MYVLRELREKSGKLSQAALAKELNVAQNTIANWENGVRQPDPDMLIKIADHFSVSIDYLLGRIDDSNITNEKHVIYDEEAVEIMREMYERPELRALFKTSKKVKAEDIKAVDDLLKRMAGGSEDEGC